MFVKRRRAALAFLEQKAKSLAEETEQVDDEIAHLEQLQNKRLKMRLFKEQQEKIMGGSRDQRWRAARCTAHSSTSAWQHWCDRPAACRDDQRRQNQRLQHRGHS